ncbi:hypothetical protein [Streptomyces anulatus]|uniref:hypothetical protein n=1 Tax=Streptomyces anulatus TaxID=1892 RepID=UPI002252712A|nr:hypothetical protein [Streptomyces anulatus]MCX4506651.1 hypothetical protein [Streptomyces anulatus]
MPAALFDDESITVRFLDRHGRRRELPVRQAVQVPFEELTPLHAPVAYPGRTSFVTKAWASATGQAVACGSLRQQRCAMLLDRDVEVTARSAGPMELRQGAAGGTVRWVRPDFVALRSGQREVIRIIPQEVCEQWDERQELLSRAADVAGWQVRTLRPPDGVELDNLQLLYAARSVRQLSVQDAALLVARFTRPRTIRCAVRAAGLPELAGVDLVFHLIWKRQLHTDMALPLTPASTAWRTEA